MYLSVLYCIVILFAGLATDSAHSFVRMTCRCSWSSTMIKPGVTLSESLPRRYAANVLEETRRITAELQKFVVVVQASRSVRAVGLVETEGRCSYPSPIDRFQTPSFPRWMRRLGFQFVVQYDALHTVYSKYTYTVVLYFFLYCISSRCCLPFILKQEVDGASPHV